MTLYNECGLIPMNEHLLKHYDESMPACILRDGHRGAHLMLTTVQGYVCWEGDEECGCEDLGCGCYTWWPINDQKAIELLSTGDNE